MLIFSRPIFPAKMGLFYFPLCEVRAKNAELEDSPHEVRNQQEHRQQEEADPDQEVGGEFRRVDLLLIPIRDNTRRK